MPSGESRDADATKETMTDPITRLNAALEGRYRIEGELGEGGMATVYLAHDERHNRNVALKVLKAELAAVVGAERFLAKIETTANLQHPHILPLFDSGEADGSLFFVTPLIEGDTLRDKIDREKQLSVDEALKITEDVASALDYAHKNGVVHRDIKPGNILLSAEGEPTVADFGIALAVAHAGGGRVTETGLSVGTPHYMSPEQATGDRDVDPRTDVYALGCVLYEMLAGEPPYTGPNAQAVLARILTGNALPPTEVRPTLPPNVDAAIRKALEKLPADRFTTTQDFAKALGDPGFRHGEEVAGAAGRGRIWNPISVAAIVVAVLAVTAAAWTSMRAAPEVGVTRLTIPVPGGYGRADWESPLLTITPDGSSVVYLSENRLHVRRLDEFESYPLEGTEGADEPFVSPDSRFVGFSRPDGRLWRIPIEGGPVQSLADVPVLYSPRAAWGETGLIAYSGGSTGAGILGVQVDGSESWPLTELSQDSGEYYHLWPQLLDGDRKLLFTVIGPGGLWEDARVVLADLGMGSRTTLRERASFGHYIDTGHILYVDSEGTLFALPFDLARSQVTGSPFPVESGIQVSGWGGSGSLAVSRSGNLAFVRGSHSEDNLLRWFDRSGEVVLDVGPPVLSGFVRLSPDGSEILTWLSRPTNADLYRIDSESGLATRATFDPLWDWSGVWSPEGDRFAYSTSRIGYNVIHLRSASGSEEPELVYEGQQELWPTSWSSSGDWLAFEDSPPDNQIDIRAVKLDEPSQLITVAATENWECCARFSPDGRWIAYQSDEDGGRPEIHVTSFPDLNRRRQVSTQGGVQPRWDPAGNELFYWQDSTLVSVRVANPDEMSTGAPEALFTLPEAVLHHSIAYDVGPTGDRFLIRVLNPEVVPREIHVISNFAQVVRDLEDSAGP